MCERSNQWRRRRCQHRPSRSWRRPHRLSARSFDVGFAPLGPADGPVKTAIFGGNNAKLYGINSKKAMLDFKFGKLSALKVEYEKTGPARSNMRYGYVVPNGPVDYSVFA